MPRAILSPALQETKGTRGHPQRRVGCRTRTSGSATSPSTHLPHIPAKNLPQGIRFSLDSGENRHRRVADLRHPTIAAGPGSRATWSPACGNKQSVTSKVPPSGPDARPTGHTALSPSVSIKFYWNVAQGRAVSVALGPPATYRRAHQAKRVYDAALHRNHLPAKCRPGSASGRLVFWGLMGLPRRALEPLATRPRTFPLPSQGQRDQLGLPQRTPRPRPPL